MAQQVASDFPITTPYDWVKGYPLNLDPNVWVPETEHRRLTC